MLDNDLKRNGLRDTGQVARRPDDGAVTEVVRGRRAAPLPSPTRGSDTPRMLLATVSPEERLRSHLETLHARYDRAWLSPDPLEFLHRYDDPRDVEVFGFYAAGLAYGRVELIRRALDELARRLGPHPARFVRDFSPRRDAARFRGFVHRFHTGKDIALLTELLHHALLEEETLGDWFARGDDPAASDIAPGLTDFCARMLGRTGLELTRGGRVPATAPVRYFFSSPAGGSACKRLNLYLRWMVRHDRHGLDFGLWRRVSPARLVIPLDTHIARIATNLGLTTRRTPDWRMALEITAALRRFDPEDPVKYDFALCRLGILELCPRRRDPAKCAACHIQPVCTL